MNLWQLTKVNIKRMAKDPSRLLFTLALPILIVMLVSFILGSGGTSSLHEIDIAINVEDLGSLGEDLVESLNVQPSVFQNGLVLALKLLESNRVVAVYQVPEDFSAKINAYQKPVIEAFIVEEGNSLTLFEMELENKINEMVKERFLINEGIVDVRDDLHVAKTETLLIRDDQIVFGQMHLILVLLISFMIMGALPVVTELMMFKKREILARAISTANNSFVVLGSLVLSHLIFQVGFNMVILCGFSTAFGFAVSSWSLVFVNFVLVSLFAMTLSLVMVRIFKNEGICSTITMLFAILALYLAMFSDPQMFPDMPQIIVNLGKFTPLYWIFDSFERLVFFPNTIVLALMVLALFSAGSYKLRNFISE